LSAHNVIAVYPDVDAAWGAVQHLVDAGLDLEGEISLLGREQEMRPAADGVEERRGGAMSGLGKGVATGAAAGGVAGAALVGLASTAAALPGIGLALGTSVVYGLATGATGGSTVGALLGVEQAGRRATMWQQTLSPLLHRVPEDGVVLVGAHVDDDERAETAREVFQEAASEVHDLEADIRYRPEVEEGNLGDRIPSGSAEAPGERSPGLKPPGEGSGAPDVDPREPHDRD
jgi:hypothetical protein